MRSSRADLRHRHALPWLVLATLLVVSSRGIAIESEPYLDAREHFDRGVQLYADGELEQALVEFEFAHRLQPHFAVLYNLGLTQAALGHSVGAVQAFRRYLSEGGERIDASRRRQVETAIQLHEKRIGSLELTGDFAQAECQLDGTPTDCNQQHVPLVAGRHVVVAKRSGYAAAVHTVEIRPGTATALEIELQPLPARSEVSLAWLRIHCGVPNVTIQVDGATLDATSLGTTLSLTSGRHSLRFSRIGYQAVETELNLAAGPLNEVSCNIAPASPLPTTQSGILQLQPSERDANAWVDGARFVGQRLPLGPHRVEVRAHGFFPWLRDVAIAPQHNTSLDVQLVPTPETRARYEAAARRERTFAYATGAAGLAASAVAIGLFVHGSNRYQQWSDDRTQLRIDVANGIGNDDFGQRLAQLNADEAKIVRIDTTAAALAVLGGAMLATASGLFIWGKDPEKYSGNSTTRVKTSAAGGWWVAW